MAAVEPFVEISLTNSLRLGAESIGWREAFDSVKQCSRSTRAALERRPLHCEDTMELPQQQHTGLSRTSSTKCLRSDERGHSGKTAPGADKFCNSGIILAAHFAESAVDGLLSGRPALLNCGSHARGPDGLDRRAMYVRNQGGGGDPRRLRMAG